MKEKRRKVSQQLMRRYERERKEKGPDFNNYPFSPQKSVSTLSPSLSILESEMVEDRQIKRERENFLKCPAWIIIFMTSTGN